MTETETRNMQLIRDYMKAIESGEQGDALRRFFTDDVRQVEFPNALNPRGGESDLNAMLARSIQGRRVLQKQVFEIVSELAQGNRAAIEAKWAGVLSIPFGALKPGDTMRANLAMFFELREGRIAVQHNYDCFDPA